MWPNFNHVCLNRLRFPNIYLEFYFDIHIQECEYHSKNLFSKKYIYAITRWKCQFQKLIVPLGNVSPTLNANRKEFRASERTCACENRIGITVYAKDEGDRVTTNDRGQGAAIAITSC